MLLILITIIQGEITVYFDNAKQFMYALCIESRHWLSVIGGISIKFNVCINQKILYTVCGKITHSYI